MCYRKLFAVITLRVNPDGCNGLDRTAVFALPASHAFIAVNFGTLGPPYVHAFDGLIPTVLPADQTVLPICPRYAGILEYYRLANPNFGLFGQIVELDSTCRAHIGAGVTTLDAVSDAWYQNW